jgi:hypothetical protein
MDTDGATSKGGGRAKKLLMPLVATAVSAAATYAGKRAPQLLEDKVMPKLRDATSGTEDIASGLAERAKSVVGHGGDDDTSGSSRSRNALSSDKLEQRRRERAEHRSSRRKAARS